jgi:hypothetical protein
MVRPICVETLSYECYVNKSTNQFPDCEDHLEKRSIPCREPNHDFLVGLTVVIYCFV